MEIQSLTNIGLIRKANEDNYLVDKDRKLFVVADGMGGHQGGKLASGLAIKTIDEYCELKEKPEDYRVLLEKIIKKANLLIYEKAHTEDGFIGMGTTVTAALFKDNNLFIANIGDSRAYIINNEKITLLTEDHSLVRVLVNKGEITEEEAINHPNKNILIRALGIEPEVDVDIFNIKVKKGDFLLLCTDGLTNLVRDKEILEIVEKNITAEDSINELMNVALNRGGNDNITIILVKCDD